MSNLFDTGSETVNRMCRLQFTGNVIPSTWYHTNKKRNRKTKLKCDYYSGGHCVLVSACGNPG